MNSPVSSFSKEVLAFMTDKVTTIRILHHFGVCLAAAKLTLLWSDCHGFILRSSFELNVDSFKIDIQSRK